jgi:hypothetical protein
MTDPEANFKNITYAADLFFDQYPDHPDVKEYSRWKQFWDVRANEAPSSNGFIDAFQAWSSFEGCIGFPCDEDEVQASWTSLGPYGLQQSTGYVGRIQSVCTDPHDPEKKIVYVGAATSGLYRTNDIYAASPVWECLTCSTGYPVLGIMSMSIDPTELEPGEKPSIFLAVAFEMYSFQNYGAGFLRSTDGGENWDFIQPAINSYFQMRTWGIVHHPVQKGRVIASVNGSLYESYDGGDNWKMVLDLYSNKRYIRDIVFHPENPNILYISGDDQNADAGGASFFVLEFDELDETWSKTEYFPFEELGWNAACMPGRMDLAVSTLAPEKVFLSIEKVNTISPQPSPCIDPTIRGAIIVFDLTTGAFEKRSNTPANWNMADIVVSPVLVNGQLEVFLGQVNIHRSVNSGMSFSSTSPSSNTFHADTRGLHAAQRSDGKRIILSGHDGGVSIFHEVNGSDKWENKTGSGLNIAQFYGIGVGTDRSKYLGGCQDEGVKSWNGTSWEKPLGSDGGECFVDLFDPDIQYAQTWSYPNTRILRKITPSSASNGDDYYDTNIPHEYIDAGDIRPMEMDQNRNLYIGHKQLYRRAHEDQPQTTGWQQIGDIPDGTEYMRTIAIAPSNSNVVYIGRGYSVTAENGMANLMVTRDADNGAGATWTKVDDFLDLYGGGWSGGGPITDIVVDPKDENRIWVSTGQFDRTYKVVMFEYNAGTWTWTNVSNGICNIPIYSLAYVHGSSHSMYAGTEFGVFYNPNASDPNSSWFCYADGMPACIITELEVNYCNNSLIAGTFGCGIWETPLAPYTNDRPMEIMENTTWPSPRICYSDVVVNPGATLRVESEVFMSRNRKIIIRPGGRMVVEGGTLSTLCDDYWYGIYVEGQYDQPQTGTQAGGPQGVLILKGAMVEKAWSAVNLHGAPGSGETSKLSGGVVQASGLIQDQVMTKTVFRNNARDFHTYPYFDSLPPPLQGQPYNLSRFVDCVFETTDAFNILASETPQEYTHANLFGVKGISFTACTFEDARTQPSPQMAGFTGITSHNSQFIVQGRCNPAGQPCETWDPTVFKNLHRAVNAGNFGETHPFTVDRCSFVNNHFGVQSWAVDYLTVTRSRFEGAGSPVVTLLPYEHEPRSITIYGGTEYTVEENTLIAPAGVPTPFDNLMGIVVIETGEDFNTIYKNELSNLTLGNLALGGNMNYLDPFFGLEYQCNKNTGNRYDFMVPDPSGPYSDAGIRQNQGSAQTSAGNKFSPLPPLPESHFFNTTFAPVTYFYKEGEPGDEPVNYSVGVSPTQAVDPNTCLSRFDQGPVIPADPIPHKVRFFERSVRLDSLKNALEAKIDGGASTSLLQAISASTAADSQAVRAQLVQLSPYVSQAALAEYLGREELFSEDQMVEVLALNPDVLRRPAFWDAAQDVLSPSAQAQLESARQMRTPRTDAEAAIAAVAAERAYAARRVVHYYLGDTLASQADSARHWIALIETLPHQYILADGYLQASDTAQAAMILNAIPAGFSLTPAQWAAHADYEALLDIRKGMAANEDWISYIQEHETELKSLAEQGVSRAAVQAQFLYNVVFGPTYHPPVSWAEGGSSQSAGKIVPPASQEWPREVSGDLKLAVLPNPARESVQFHYSIPGVEKGAQLRVFDPSGRVIRIWELKTNTGVIQWQVAGEAPKGIYLVSLAADGTVPVTTRFSIVE